MRQTLVLALALVALACGGEKSSDAGRQTPDAKRPTSASRVSSPESVDSLMAHVIPAAAVTLAVQAAPERADSILAENGFTLDRFEATLYTIAADSAASQLFEAALGR